MTSDKLGQSLKDEFLSICRRDIYQSEIEKLLGWVEEGDFFYAPASTRFYGNYKYGLLKHSLNAYRTLKKLVKQHEEVKVSDETLTISTLFHDICKANLYAIGSRNVKDEQTGQWREEAIYKYGDQFPVGHGEKPVITLLRRMAPTDDEIYAIRFHAGGFDSVAKGGDGSIGKACELCPLTVLLHLADVATSYLMGDHNA